MTARHDIKPCILLVDDHPANLITLEAVLGTSEYTLLSASSGPEALDILQKQDVALVLLDVQMPGMDGYEVMRRIKSNERTKNLPVILITAIYTEDPHVRKGYEQGAIDYFAKPFNPDLLRSKVGIYAELYAKNALLKRREQEQLALERRVRDLCQSSQELELARERQIAARQAELRTLLESIPDAVYVGDKAGITQCNKEALDLFGIRTHGEFIKHFGALAARTRMRYAASDELIPAPDQPYAHALRGEQFIGDIKIQHGRTGLDVVIACAASPIILTGEIIGAVVVNVIKSPLSSGRDVAAGPTPEAHVSGRQPGLQ